MIEYHEMLGIKNHDIQDLLTGSLTVDSFSPYGSIGLGRREIQNSCDVQPDILYPYDKDKPKPGYVPVVIVGSFIQLGKGSHETIEIWRRRRF